VIAEAPGLVGVVHETTAWAFPGAADTPDGADGRVPADGVTAGLAIDAGLVPIALVALTVKVYLVPFVRPDITRDVVVPPTLAVAPPGVALTVYAVTGLPLADDGPQLTTACALPATAETGPGAPGGVATGRKAIASTPICVLAELASLSPTCTVMGLPARTVCVPRLVYPLTEFWLTTLVVVPRASRTV
jgi:hypothetical protein